ncbi:hypothetical protein [Okeania sp. SIO3I5]|nr:hypothetical protein [Okeania sp. SIO3I5]
MYQIFWVNARFISLDFLGALENEDLGCGWRSLLEIETWLELKG